MPWLRGMKLKTTKVLSSQLKKRLILSFSLGFLFFAIVITTFLTIRSQPKVGGIPSTLRRSHLWNEELWKILRSSRGMTKSKPKPLAGTKPRVNGLLGLKSPIDLDKHVVQILTYGKLLTLPYKAFTLLPKVEYSTEFFCIEGWSEDVHYAGARFSDFLEAYNLGKKPDGTYYQYVGFETPDRGYYVSLDMESLLHPQTVLAYEMNQMPLSLDNGAPLRLIIPIKYGIKSIKRIGKIYFSDRRPPDYWAEQGYDWDSGL